jgi:hypothetical protein
LADIDALLLFAGYFSKSDRNKNTLKIDIINHALPEFLL